MVRRVSPLFHLSVFDFTLSSVSIENYAKIWYNVKKGGEKVKSDYIDPKLLDVLLATMHAENALAVRVSLETGLRIGDVLSLRREAIAQSERITVVEKKTGKEKEIRLSARTREAVLTQSEGYEWAFPSPLKLGQPRRRQTVWRDVKRAATFCGLTLNITPHTARKVYAVSKFKREGLKSTQDALNHDNITTTLLYAFSDALTARKELEEKQPEGLLAAFFAALVRELGGNKAVERALRRVLEKAEQ